MATDSHLDALVEAARQRMEHEFGPCDDADWAALLAWTAAAALYPDAAWDRPVCRPAEWVDAASRATAWLTEHEDALRSSVAQCPKLGTLARRIGALAGDVLTSAPLSPPLRLIEQPWTPSSPIDVLLFDSFSHVSHELWPLMVEGLQAALDRGFDGEVLAAHTSWLDRGAQVRRAERYDAVADRLLEHGLVAAMFPRSAHLLHGPVEGETEWHRAMSERLLARGVAVANPYDVSARADDKWRTYELLLAAGVPTPRTWLLSKGAGVADADALLGSLDVARHRHVVLKPRYGTAGRGVAVVDARADRLLDAIPAAAASGDVIAQPFCNDLRVPDDEGRPVPAVLRFNVTLDGSSRRHVDSGYVHVGRAEDDMVVNVATSGRSTAVDFERLSVHGEVLPLAFVSSVVATVTKGVDAVDPGRLLRLVGVDVVVGDDGAGDLTGYVLDMNPRPAGLIRSRLIDVDTMQSGEVGVSRALWYSS